MATNAPDSRKTHVIRIFGTNKNKDILHDIWVDVERIDESGFRDKVNGVSQILKRKLRWRDDPKNEEEYLDPDIEDTLPQSGPSAPKRKTVLLKVCSPDEEDLDNPNEWVPIRVLKRIRSKTNSQKSNKKQEQYEKLINDDIQHSRVVETRRIVHYDTNIDAKVEKEIARDPTLKVYVVKGHNKAAMDAGIDPNSYYTKKDGTHNNPNTGGTEDTTKDESQWVEHEIIMKVIHKGNSVYHGNGNEPNDLGPAGRQTRKTKYLNQYQIDESDPAESNEKGKGDVNPPYRLDPFQNIINVQLQPTDKVVVGALSVTDTSSDTLLSKDGKEWITGFDPESSNAASGLGYTVIGKSEEFDALQEGSNIRNSLVAFGKPRDGLSCFIVAGPDAAIRRGVITNGELKFTTTGTLPGVTDAVSSRVFSCSFAGGAFFISYNRSGDDAEIKTFLAVSFDGKNFDYDINAFRGVEVANIYNPEGLSGATPSPKGGSVVYDKKNEFYVTVGRYLRHYTGFYTTAAVGDNEFSATDNNFMSAKSKDGVNWTPYFDKSQGVGNGSSINAPNDIGGAFSSAINDTNGSAPHVTFGKGLFVATTHYKVRTRRVTGADTHIEYIPACSVATSSDGATWTNRRLPNSIAFYVTPPPTPGSVGGPGGIAAGGSARSVKFYRTGGNTSDGYPEGFFVVGGLEFTPDSTFPFSRQYAGKLWFSEDGTAWNLTKTTGGTDYNILSTVNKSVTPETKTLFRL